MTMREVECYCWSTCNYPDKHTHRMGYRINEKKEKTMNEYATLPPGLRAYDNHVIVAMKKLTQTTAGGIQLPRALETEYGKGVVLSVGHGVERVRVGDVVQWKDTVTYLGNDKIVHNDAAVFIDKGERVVAVKKEMIISVRDASTT